MKIYHVKTQQSYNELMSELEEKGYKWLSGHEPTSKKYWIVYKENSCINISSKYITFMNIEQSKKQHPNIPIIEYKAKGETKMTNEEMKRKLQKNAFDVYVAVDIFAARGISESEKDLQEAKSSAKKLIEKIDEYLESMKPEFKVGDYVVLHAFHKEVAKIDKICGDKLHGLWYDTKNESIGPDYFLGSGTAVKHATPEEIAEYEVSLTFHKHGRKPFEVKEGDLIKYPNGQNIMIYHPDCFSKTDFLNDGFKLIKTAEEVNEWLENK